MTICRICGKDVDIRTHIKVHKLTSKEYYDEYIKKENEGICPICGKETKFLGILKGYRQYCSNISYKKYNNCIVNVQDILTDNNKEYDCLFTCPPYGGKEHWNKDNDEIEKSCDEWINICLNKYNCKKYLFVVDKTEKYKNNIIETLENKSHFGKNNEYVILIKKE